ncbi:hypothetical protein OQJ13_05315 [Legionella sp. PATHC035]|uniref:hypothetical protein n=1 Tax=Legionella sp. PATHC035 TaxID=2992040 RepID=UPI0022430E1F|nr:hypothetical protein [Legionella sp. PATHC035]MCW8408386.1 hypothetical protein [Legionella sp. PATHC035]
MKDKQCINFSYLFSGPNNKPVIFITNAPNNERGSSLYLVHENGTIRCSGSNEGKRKATTFIRPYLIGYLTPKKQNMLFDEASIGLFPFEACAKSYHELLQIKKCGYGHEGNTITEIISFQDLMTPYFTPLSWQGSDKGGTDWDIAQREILDAWQHVSLKNYDFSSEERHIEHSEFRQSGI